MSKRFLYNYQYTLLLAGISLLLNACIKDIVEPDLSKQNITLLTPADNYSTTTTTQTFMWDSIEGTIKYNFQIATPSFSALQKILIDTNIRKIKCSFTLAPGTYQWRVKAINSSSSSAYSVFNIRIDSTGSLSNQSVILLSPSDNLITKKKQHTFKWIKLKNAEDYRFQAITSTNTIIADTVLKNDSLTYTLSEAAYKWQVRAQNSLSNSFYTTRSITIDITPPPVSTQSFPDHKDTLTATDSLAWIRSAATIGDSIFIYSDSLAVSKVYVGYTTVLYYKYKGIANKNYFWRLKSKDVAENWSAYGALWRFTYK